MARMSALSQSIIATSAGRPERPNIPRKQRSLEQEALSHKSSAPLSILRCDFACFRFQEHRIYGRGGREMHVARQSASDDAGVVRRWLSTSRDDHVAARSSETRHHIYAAAKKVQ